MIALLEIALIWIPAVVFWFMLAGALLIMRVDDKRRLRFLIMDTGEPYPWWRELLWKPPPLDPIACGVCMRYRHVVALDGCRYTRCPMIFMGEKRKLLWQPSRNASSSPR